MEIRFTDRKLLKICSNERRMQGLSYGKRLRQRLTELQGADTLSDISHLPQARCHELHHDRSGQLAVDLDHPFRLIFRPDHKPIPRKKDGGLDWTKVTKIVIVEIADYHG